MCVGVCLFVRVHISAGVCVLACAYRVGAYVRSRVRAHARARVCSWLYGRGEVWHGVLPAEMVRAYITVARSSGICSSGELGTGVIAVSRVGY